MDSERNTLIQSAGPSNQNGIGYGSTNPIHEEDETSSVDSASIGESFMTPALLL